MDKFECAYAAGLLDGEGSIGVYLRKNGKYRNSFLSVNIANTFLPALVWLRDRWGGYISPPRQDNERCKLLFHWTLASNRAAAFLVDVQPFVIIKRGQLENGLAFQATKRKGPKKLTTEDWARVEAFVQMSRELNKSGPPR